ncbi:MAG: hypothetical protein SOU51_07140 [Collinsella sp.]|nr:hypothetical protein [Collinsella sp.]
MKKRIALIAMIPLLAVLSLVLVGCGGPSVEELIREDISAQFDGVKAGDSDLIDGIEEGAGEDLEMLGVEAKDFASSYLDGFDYKIESVDVDEGNGTAVAHVKLTCKSMTEILTGFQTAFEEKVQSMDISSITEDELYKLGGEVMIDVINNLEPHEADVDIKYNKVSDNEWEIDSSAEAELLAALMS